MKRPLIGIPAFASPGTEYSPTRFVINQAYPRAVSEAGGLPILIPIIEDRKVVQAIYERLDGLLLPGGADLGSRWFGGHITGDPELERDRLELQLAHLAYKADLPTFGICRGQQLMNVALGGTLYQDLASQRYGQRHASETRRELTHGVEIDPKSRLGKTIGVDAMAVNSLHHQAVDRLAHGLLPTAYADDQLIEALEAPDKLFWLGVQWHPEELRDEPSERLFQEFISASTARRS